jgi:hypothetical protein
MPLLEIRNLARRFDDLIAVENILANGCRSVKATKTGPTLKAWNSHL